MSYSATICFKTIKEGEMYSFFKKIKDTCKEKFDEYGNIFELEKVFENGYVPRHRKKKYESEGGE
jgi:hypothetical protein